TTRDKNGNPVRNANDRVTVRVNGAGVLVGLDNGDSATPTSTRPTAAAFSAAC
ncbi:hypothetical protein OBE_16851, partial [human gut metagenome]